MRRRRAKAIGTYETNPPWLVRLSKTGVFEVEAQPAEAERRRSAGGAREPQRVEAAGTEGVEDDVLAAVVDVELGEHAREAVVIAARAIEARELSALDAHEDARPVGHE